MTPAAEVLTVAATSLGIIVVLGKGLRKLLTAFHHEHVAPSIAAVTTAIAHNTEATASLTASLTTSQAAQDRGFERLGDIITDHETRITVLEQPAPRPRSAAIKRGRAA